MTVIAYDGKTLASDSMISTDGGYWAECKKIKKVDGWLIGGAGGWDMVTHFLAKFHHKLIAENKPYQPVNPAPSKGDFEAIAISPKGVVYYIEDSGVFGLIKIKKHIAIGSGTPCAMSAMEAGATATEAVKIAIKYARGCGGAIQSLTLQV